VILQEAVEGRAARAAGTVDPGDGRMVAGSGDHCVFPGEHPMESGRGESDVRGTHMEQSCRAHAGRAPIEATTCEQRRKALRCAKAESRGQVPPPRGFVVRLPFTDSHPAACPPPQAVKISRAGINIALDSDTKKWYFWYQKRGGCNHETC
jgi:hypothetical protein